MSYKCGFNEFSKNKTSIRFQYEDNAFDFVLTYNNEDGLLYIDITEYSKNHQSSNNINGVCKIDIKDFDDVMNKILLNKINIDNKNINDSLVSIKTNFNLIRDEKLEAMTQMLENE